MHIEQDSTQAGDFSFQDSIDLGYVREVLRQKKSVLTSLEKAHALAIVANAICGGLGVDTKAAVKECRKANMFLDEFSCCEDTCGDVC